MAYENWNWNERKLPEMLKKRNSYSKVDEKGFKYQIAPKPNDRFDFGIFDNFFVDRNRLAKILSIGPSTVSKLMAEEGLPNYKIGKSCRFKVSEVMAFLEKRRRP